MIKRDRFFYINRRLAEIKNPIIVELGVDKTALSTKNFLNYINDNGGKLYSIDIKDFSHVLKQQNFNNYKIDRWRFLKSNDLNLQKIFDMAPEITKGIDLLYVDSLHDPTHVKNIIEKWFNHVNKMGYIFFDDTESRLYREQKALFTTIINDGINNIVKAFFYKNSNLIEYTKYYCDTGLSEYFKICERNTLPNKISSTWGYNYYFGKLYLLILRLVYLLKKKRQKKNNILNIF